MKLPILAFIVLLTISDLAMSSKSSIPLHKTKRNHNASQKNDSHLIGYSPADLGSSYYITVFDSTGNGIPMGVSLSSSMTFLANSNCSNFTEYYCPRYNYLPNLTQVFENEFFSTSGFEITQSLTIGNVLNIEGSDLFYANSCNQTTTITSIEENNLEGIIGIGVAGAGLSKYPAEITEVTVSLNDINSDGSLELGYVDFYTRMSNSINISSDQNFQIPIGNVIIGNSTPQTQDLQNIIFSLDLTGIGLPQTLFDLFQQQLEYINCSLEYSSYHYADISCEGSNPDYPDIIITTADNYNIAIGPEIYMIESNNYTTGQPTEIGMIGVLNSTKIAVIDGYQNNIILGQTFMVNYTTTFLFKDPNAPRVILWTQTPSKPIFLGIVGGLMVSGLLLIYCLMSMECSKREEWKQKNKIQIMAMRKNQVWVRNSLLENLRYSSLSFSEEKKNL